MKGPGIDAQIMALDPESSKEAIEAINTVLALVKKQKRIP